MTRKTPDMALFQYPDYEAYVKAQSEGNRKKLNRRGVFPEAVAWMAEIIKDRHPYTRGFGLCHGSRAGWEQKWFKEALGRNWFVIGTEIGETAELFKDTIRWDFHDLKEGWIDHIDFIYSNAWDHLMEPERGLGNWLKCLDPETGIMFLEHSGGHLPEWVTELDPFGATLPALVGMLEKLGGKVHVTNEFPFKVPDYIPNLHILAVTR